MGPPLELKRGKAGPVGGMSFVRMVRRILLLLIHLSPLKSMSDDGPALTDQNHIAQKQAKKCQG